MPINLPCLSIRKNKPASYTDLLKPAASSFSATFSYHCLEASLRPYKHFISLHSLPGIPASLGGLTKTCLFISEPCRKADLISVAVIVHSLAAAIAKTVLKLAFCNVGLSLGISSSSWKPRAVNLALASSPF